MKVIIDNHEKDAETTLCMRRSTADFVVLKIAFDDDSGSEIKVRKNDLLGAIKAFS